MSAAMHTSVAAVLAAGLMICTAGCGREEPPVEEASRRSEPAIPVQFTAVTDEAGIDFAHHTGARGRKYLPETMGSGLVWFDYDGDQLPDLFLVNSTDWPESRQGSYSQALYRNRGDGTFEDVTKAAGLVADLYGIGAAAGDYDNDGDCDLFVNALGPDRLYRNRGDGVFEDVTDGAGVSDESFGSSATWLDFDRDGLLDLFVCNYVQWTPATDIYCTLDGEHKSYCTPESYRGASDRLYRNRGDGRFEDVTETAGLLNGSGKSLGVVALDYNGDGFTDLAVANDTQPNFLYRNEGNGTFTEVGRAAGIAFSEEGRARGAMGIDAADYDDSGRESLMIGNFSNEMVALYHNRGQGLFTDDAAAAGIGQPSLLTLAFGCFFFDFDLDGRLDIFVANGHVENDINRVQPSVTYAQSPHLFRGVDGGRFEVFEDRVGADLSRPIVARGAAYADYDGDGDLDIALSTSGGQAILLRNDGGNANSWVRLKLRGDEANRDAIGAVVRLTSGGRAASRVVRSASSYASQNEMVLTFGLGGASGDAPAEVDVEVTWPGGERQSFPNLATRRLHLLEQAPATAGAQRTEESTR